MPVTYSQTAIDARLQAVATLLNGGQFILYAGSTVICTINLNNPSGTVSGGVFTITPPLPGVAVASGLITTASLQTSAAVTIISGLTVGIPLSGEEVIIVNTFSSTLVAASQPVQVIAAQITGS